MPWPIASSSPDPFPVEKYRAGGCSDKIFATSICPSNRCSAVLMPSPPAAVMSCWSATAAGTRRPSRPAQAGSNPSADRCPFRLGPAQPTSAATPHGSMSFGSLGLVQSVAASHCQTHTSRSTTKVKVVW